MVHGGGHHHHHHQQQKHQQQQWRFASSSPRNVVFVDNRTPAYPTFMPWGPSPYTMYNTTPSINRASNDCDTSSCCWNCFRACFCALLCCCCCNACSGQHQPTTTTTNARSLEQQYPRNIQQQDNNNNYPNVEPSPFGCCRCIRRPAVGFMISILLAVILITSSTLQETWMLDPGESRQIHVPALQRKISISSILDPNGSQNVAIYEIPTACPPLTGPTIHLQSQPQRQQRTSIQLGTDDYQYDYFYLNQNSQIHVDLSAIQGSTNVYLLRGNHVLHQLEDNSSSDDDDSDQQHWSKHAITKRFISKNSYSSAKIDYQVPHSDTYVLVYDNASTNPSALSVYYDVTLTTYNLHNYTPTCTILSSSPCVLEWEEKNPQCVLLQVQSTSSSSSSSTNSAENNPVTIQIQGESRHWWRLILFSCIPIGITILSNILSRGWHRIRYDYQPVRSKDVGDFDDEAIRPPAEAPAQPSAPVLQPISVPMMDEGDYGSIPIVEAEYIAPIAPPYLLK